MISHSFLLEERKATQAMEGIITTALLSFLFEKVMFSFFVGVWFYGHYCFELSYIYYKNTNGKVPIPILDF